MCSHFTRGGRQKWWHRRGSKKSGYRYLDSRGKQLSDAAHIERINSLVIPPAWKNVRISPAPNGRLQAIGMDAAGRVQYLYHVNFVARQQRKKFAKVERFGEFLPGLRRLTNEHIALEGFPRERVLAIIIRLINDLYLRVGSEDSVKKYRTYGVTTLRNRHLDIKRGGRLIFSFVGKHHIHHRRIIVDEELTTLMKDLKALGGTGERAKLFNYLDETNHVRPILPCDVNEYIKAATAPEFTAKDFRTWGGTLLAAIELAEIGADTDEKEINYNTVKAVKRVAGHLGNTPAVCRSSYIHPLVIEKYRKGITLNEFRPRAKRFIRRLEEEYQPEETALLKLLRG